jgi:X-Pro dipeptidyl-peptidase
VGNPLQHDDRRVVFLSPVLSEPVHISGETRVTVQTKIGGQNATFSAFLVDYGTAERINHTGGGSSGGILGVPGATCFGAGTDADTGCYPNVTLRTHTAGLEVVTRGWAHAAFQLGQSPLDPAATYELTWNLQHHDYVFEAGHRIGLVVSGPETRLASGRHPTTNNQVEIVLGQSRVELPVVGGAAAIRSAFE